MPRVSEGWQIDIYLRFLESRPAIPSDAIYYPAVGSLGFFNLHLFCQCRLAFQASVAVRGTRSFTWRPWRRI